MGYYMGYYMGFFAIIEMVFCFENCSDIHTVRKKSFDREIEAEGRDF
jgi:hypothetical protein